MKTAGHVMILASAGSGKTYALTNRFVRLLALGARPERIVALTFTRKAAGEFFDEILNKLGRAASEPGYAVMLAEDIGEPALGSADFLAMLRDVVDAMPRLRLGTLDGFFARIARNFPFELGLTGEFGILQEHEARMERSRVLRRMFQSRGGLDEAQRGFIEAFKRATFGVEEKRLAVQLDGFLDRHLEVFLDAPDGDLWGNSQRIWPEGCDWLAAAGKRETATHALRAALARLEMSDGQRTRWETFFADLAVWSPGVPPERGMDYLLKNALEAWPDLGEVRIDRRKLALPTPVRAELATLVAGIVGAELGRRLETTRGIHTVLAAYDAVYHDAVRREGRLTFSDVQRLLQPDTAGARPLSSQTDGDGRLFIDYRLDAATDHWLLDEFQDTSFGQWSVLRPLIDEVVQDPTGRRSFFYVGDVKQAIFAWREGDPRLFREIFEHYNTASPGIIAEQHLVKSWRSGPALIAMVNRVFADRAALAKLFPGGASDDWNREWRDHESAKPGLDGQAAWLHAESDDEEDRFAAALALLLEIRPAERGLTCALLVQRNDTAARLADYLRREGGLPAMAESDLHVCMDNPLGMALLALVRAAAHPGDTLAQGHVRMTPLGVLLDAGGLGGPEELTHGMLGQIHAEGFERTLAGWVRRLEPYLDNNDTFSRERGRQFTAAAGRFDATGSRDVAEFIQFMERHAVRESETSEVLRVMTVHKAKGLGFDVVILPDLEGTRLDQRRDGLGVQRAADRSIRWVLDLPARRFVDPDPVLAAHVQAQEDAACYEKLSLLYVAMTRAKQAMYLVTKTPGKSSSRNFPMLLAETLGVESIPIRVGKHEFTGSWVEGEGDWMVDLAAVTPPVGSVREIVRLNPTVAGQVRRLAARRPSADRSRSVSGASWFALEGGGPAAFGTAVHDLLAEVEWGGPEEVARLVALWRERGTSPEVLAEAEACLRAPELTEVWRSTGSAEIWRERSFEAVVDDVWVTGVFDRVVVELDEDGRPEGATVYDFKTTVLPPDADPVAAASRHAVQMTLYRRVAARLAGLKEERVRVEIVLTSVRLRMRL